MSSFENISKIWSGPYEHFPYTSNQSVGKVLLKKLSQKPDEIAQIHDDAGTTLTNNELRILSIRAAQYLSKLGLQKGDVIGLVCKNSQYLMPVVIGCFLNGFPINPMEPTFDQNEIYHFFNKTEPKVVFIDFDCLKPTQNALEMMNSDAEIITMIQKVEGLKFVDEILTSTQTEDLYIAPDFENIENAIAIILSSSGTTGLPKAVIISHAQCLYFGMSKLWEPIDGAKYFNFSTIYWISGMSRLIYALMHSQTYVFTTKTFSPEIFMQIVRKHQLTHIYTNVLYIQRMLSSGKLSKSGLSSVQFYLTAGNSISKAAIEKFREYLQEGAFTYGYGQTEAFYIIAKNNGLADWKSVGPLSVNMQMKVVDEDGNPLNQNEQGDLLIKTPCPFLGYYKDLEATENSVESGWLKTGDVGYFNNEGHLFLVDRKKDLIRYNYSHIYPTELEQLIQTLDGVLEVCVVPIKSLEYYEFPAAVVVKIKGSDLKEQDVLDIVAKNLSDYKKLRGGVFFVDQIPRTKTDKALRRIVTETANILYQEREIGK